MRIRRICRLRGVWLWRKPSSDDHKPESKLGDRRRHPLHADSEWHEFYCLGKQRQVERHVINDDLCDRSEVTYR